MCKGTTFPLNQQENNGNFYISGILFVIIRQIMEWDRRIDPLRGESMYLSLWSPLIRWSVIENYGSGVPVILCRRGWTVVTVYSRVPGCWARLCGMTCESVTRHLDDGNVLRGDWRRCMGGLWRGLSSWLFFSFLLFFLFPSFFSRVPYYILINKRARWT